MARTVFESEKEYYHALLDQLFWVGKVKEKTQQELKEELEYKTKEKQEREKYLKRMKKIDEEIQRNWPKKSWQDSKEYGDYLRYSINK